MNFIFISVEYLMRGYTIAETEPALVIIMNEL